MNQIQSSTTSIHWSTALLLYYYTTLVAQLCECVYTLLTTSTLATVWSTTSVIDSSTSRPHRSYSSTSGVCMTLVLLVLCVCRPRCCGLGFASVRDFEPSLRVIRGLSTTICSFR